MRVRLRRETRDDPALAATTSSSGGFSEARVPALLRATPDTIFAVDTDGRILSVAPSGENSSLPSLRPEARLDEIFPAGPAGDLRAGVVEALQSGEPQTLEFSLSTDGPTTHWSATVAAAVAREAVVVLRDFTELREAQATLARAGQLESLGAIVGVVTHDFNNLLTGILANAELAQAQLRATSPAGELVAQIEIAARRAAELTAQLGSSIGASETSRETLDLNALIEELIALLEPGPLADIAMTLDLAPEVTSVHAHPAQLRQVIMNLAINAAEAVAGAGEVTIRTRVIRQRRPPGAAANVTAAAANVAAVRVPSGDYIALEVLDTGPGMDPATQARAFDLFFSTKSGERGLGLAGAREIVAAHGGSIAIESALGAGTTFTVLLPHASEKPPAPARAEANAAWEAEGSVLIVDDDLGIRTLAARILGGPDLHIELASDVAEALGRIRSAREAFGCVLLDLTLRGGSGLQVLEHIRNLGASSSVVLMTGQPCEELRAQAAALGVTTVLEKPFDSTQLRTIVGAALAQGRGA